MTGQVLDSPVASLVLPVLMRPILSTLERQDMAASQTLRAALSKVLKILILFRSHKFLMINI